MGGIERLRTPARIALGLIRLINGMMALFTSAALARRLGLDPQAQPGMLYMIRMFGIRTILLGLTLLLPGEERQRRAVRVAPLIHASDTTAATLALLGGHLPPRAARAAVAISSVNIVLSLLAQPAKGSHKG